MRRSTAIDVLVVNAGGGRFVPFADLTPEIWDEIQQVNLRGCVFAAQKALPKLRDGGAIVFTGSIGAVLALPGNAAYAASKAGLRAAARVLGAELVGRGIRVNMVSPGPTETPIIQRGGMSEEQIAGLREVMIANIPMHRMGEAAEVARAILFLASDEASFINGVDLFVDGGAVELDEDHRHRRLGPIWPPRRRRPARARAGRGSDPADPDARTSSPTSRHRARRSAAAISTNPASLVEAFRGRDADAADQRHPGRQTGRPAQGGDRRRRGGRRAPYRLYQRGRHRPRQPGDRRRAITARPRS